MARNSTVQTIRKSFMEDATLCVNVEILQNKKVPVNRADCSDEFFNIEVTKVVQKTFETQIVIDGVCGSTKNRIVIAIGNGVFNFDVKRVSNIILELTRK